MQKEQKSAETKAFEKEIKDLRASLNQTLNERDEAKRKILVHEQTEKDMTATILAYDDLIKSYRAIIIDMGRAIDHKCKQPFFDDKVFVIRDGRKFYLR